jgi:hypothetical protein
MLRCIKKPLENMDMNGSSSWKITYPLWSRSNILKATLKLDSGMLSNVTKKIYLHEATLKIKMTYGLRKSSK